MPVIAPEQRPAVQRFVAIAACSLLLTTTAITAVSTVWARDMRQPRITLLGSGKQVSVLVSTGAAMVLIVAGDDPDAFSAALNRARSPLTRRLDVLLVGGISSAFVPRLESLTNGSRAIGYLAAPPDVRSANAAETAEVEVMRTERRLRLPDDVTITIEPEAAMTAIGERRNDSIPHWKAMIGHGRTRVLIFSDGNAATRSPENGTASAVIVTGDDPETALHQIDAQLFAFSADALSGKTLRQQIEPTLDNDSWAIRVFPGEAIRLDLTRSGLRFDERDAQSLRARLGSATPYVER